MKSTPLSIVVSFFVFAAIGWLQAEPVKDGAVTVELVAENEAITPGETFTVGIRFEIEKPWHIYWINPGGPGFAPEVKWLAPEGIEAGPLQFTTPHHFFAAGSEGYGYEEKALLLVDLKAPDNLKAGDTLNLTADVGWLACAESCIPGGAELTLEIPVAAEAKPGPNADAVAASRADMPKSVDWPLSAEFDAEAKTAVFTIEHGGAIENANDLYLYTTAIYKFQSLVDANTPAKFTLDGNALKIDVSVSEKFDGKAPDYLEAVLTSKSGFTDGTHSVWLSNKPAGATDGEVSVPAAAGGEGEDIRAKIGFLGALFSAFLGGLILNVMPCVFPVISLKILSFVQQAGEDRRKVAMHGFSFAGGVIGFFWLIVGILLIVRAASGGSEGGWGSQFQSPMFVMIMTFVILLIALNLFGVFEIGTGLGGVGGKLTSAEGYGGSFWSGALAVILATPCTAPFMASAVAYGLNGNTPAVETFTVFTIMGIGMASPYIILSLVPGAMSKLPKPGEWMTTFKQAMGFPMIAVVFYLIWVVTGQLSSAGLAWFFLGLTVISIGVWWAGSFATPIRGTTTRIVARVAAVLLISLGVFSAFKGSKSLAPAIVQDVEATIAQHQENGKAVFVDFTARWCLICQANKKAMHAEEVESAFEDKDVEFMRVDWTSRDPKILAVLQKYGSEGVPLYLLFDEDPSVEPVRLPNTLTKGIILDAVEELE